MANIFKRFTEVVNKPNRATYDLSFQNNLTMKFGTLYPVFCKEVIPGDSFRIKPTFNFNFMPLVSPVQTRMKANLHFFYVRNRPHWKDFMDWDGMTKEGLVPPYLEINETNRDMIETGSIGDFLGLPTKVFDNVYDGIDVTMRVNDPIFGTGFGWYEEPLENDQFMVSTTSQFNSIVVGSDYTSVLGYTDVIPADKSVLPVHAVLLTRDDFRPDVSNMRIEFSDVGNIDTDARVLIVGVDGKIKYVSDSFTIPSSASLPFVYEFESPLQSEWLEGESASRTPSALLCVIGNTAGINQINPLPTFKYGRFVSSEFDVSERDLSEIPWANGQMRINAFPFRAYESIYNSFYRDDRNNPRMVNGQPEYNKFITTDDGGADSTHYKLFQRNWESDFLTTAVQSPQQGVAPLVGITSVNAVGEIQLEDASGNTYTAKTTLADDGDTIVGINITSGNGTASVNRALVDMASTGISISDLRNVNALQRWLEINMRRGLRYRDQVKSHYGVDLEYKELNMPEFIGGVSEDVIVNRISQTVETEDNPLGSLAGQAGVLGTSRHDISHYCDEKGYIIGILSISPVPNYSQLLPKHLLKNSQLDYFTPEFNNIGMQPILNSEVTPLQASLEGKLNDVFGYQRPWYDYLASVDEVHGQFRDTMRRYLINRVYDGTPELGSEFLTIDPEQINDVFAVTSDTDKIYGQIWFDVTAKRPIAANVTPRIEP